MGRWRTIIRACGIATAGALVVFLYLGFFWSDEDRGSHLPHVNWLPAEASDISYFRRKGFGWFRCYECTLPQEALNRLAQKEGWKLAPKDGADMHMRHKLGLPALKKDEWGETYRVSKALFFEKRHANRGGITVIYDLATNRLLVYSSHR